ncbi:MAG: hypothetical protein H5T69_04195 [Chloroflexi bacterium]|nr:hypothetical protein [Chloroflexota bacterium]
MAENDHLFFLAHRRAEARARAEEALAAADEAWNALQALNERVAKGEAYCGEHADDRRARQLLWRIKRERAAAKERWEGLHEAFLRAEESYLLSARECRLYGMAEEDR